jgi:hypothetical protein
MFQFLFNRWRAKPPTQDQLRKAKKLGIKSASQMSRQSLVVLIERAERERAAAKK